MGEEIALARCQVAGIDLQHAAVFLKGIIGASDGLKQGGAGIDASEVVGSRLVKYVWILPQDDADGDMRLLRDGGDQLEGSALRFGVGDGGMECGGYGAVFDCGSLLRKNLLLGLRH